MRLTLSLLLLNVALLCYAAELGVPATVMGQVGGFISIPVQADSSGDLEILLPEGLQLVGTPQLRDGQGLINVLVLNSALAGDKRVTVRLLEAGRVVAEAEVAVSIAVEAAFSVRAPSGDTVVNGDEVDYVLLVTNQGNAQDTFRLTQVSTVPARLEPETLTLEPGATGEVALRVDSEGTREATSFVTVTSGLDPELRESVVIRTTVLPFAGADAIDGPALAYGVAAEGGYASGGLEYRLNARLNGELSEFVEVGSDLSFQNGALSGQAGLKGQNWGVGYRGLATTQRLEGYYGPYQGFFALLLGSGFATGAAYTAEPLELSLTHQTAQQNTDTFRARYRFDVQPTLSLSPFVSVQGQGSYGGEYLVSTTLGVGARLATESLNGRARVQFSVPFRGLNSWLVAVALSNRVQIPVGVTGELALSPDGLGLGVTTREVLTTEIDLAQSFTYAGDLTFQRTRYDLVFGVNYRPALLPIALSGSVNAALIQNRFSVGFGFAGSYEFNQFGVEAAVFYREFLRYSAALTYSHSAFDATLVYLHAEESDEIALGIGGEYERFVGSLIAAYDFTGISYGIDADLKYSFSQNYGIFGGVGLSDEAFSFRVGASIGLFGGFATPNSVVDFFGGRVIGTVEGRVFHDLNRNGLRETGEPVPTGLSVRAGQASAEVGTDGNYRLVLPPGSYTLSLGNLPADLGLTSSAVVEVVQNQAVQANLAVETVVGFTGVVFDDQNRNGAQDEGEAGLPYVRVVLNSQAREAQSTLSDNLGSFFFQALQPDLYTVRIGAESLPEFFEITTPPTEVDLQSGPFPRLSLGATARPKEVKQTLTTSSLAVFARVEPLPAAPGSSVKVRAEVQGEPERVAAVIGQDEYELSEVENGVFEGRATLPDEAVGVVTVIVRAYRGEEAEEQQTLVIVDPNRPLATLELSSALLDPAEILTVTSEFYKDLSDPYILIGDERYELQRVADYLFELSVAVPQLPDTYEVRLMNGTNVIAETRFRVDATEP